jgi:hypothetical protein
MSIWHWCVNIKYTLYWRLPADRDLSLKHIGGFIVWITCNFIQFVDYVSRCKRLQTQSAELIVDLLILTENLLRERWATEFIVRVKVDIVGNIQGGPNMTGTNCDLFTYKSSRSYLNHLVLHICVSVRARACSRVAWACACACVHVALLIQHANCMLHVVTSAVALLAPPYFQTLSHKRHGFRKRIIEHKMCVLIFCTMFVWDISHSEKNSARYCHKFEQVFT